MPSNQFNGERNSMVKIHETIKNALLKSKGTMFKLLGLGNVNGPKAHHLYKFMRQKAPENYIQKHEDGPQIISVDGNFAMFLVG